MADPELVRSIADALRRGHLPDGLCTSPYVLAQFLGACLDAYSRTVEDALADRLAALAEQVESVDSIPPIPPGARP